jgi:hypothetical protein
MNHLPWILELCKLAQERLDGKTQSKGGIVEAQKENEKLPKTRRADQTSGSVKLNQTD